MPEIESSTPHASKTAGWAAADQLANIAHELNQLVTATFLLRKSNEEIHDSLFDLVEVISHWFKILADREDFPLPDKPE